MKNKRNQKILIVDDNPKNLQVAMNILKDYNVIYAQSGEKALEHTKQNDFDLILLDIVMPNLSGYDVCKILKDDSKTKNIPIIFLTIKDEEKDIVEGFNLGAVDYLTKPFQAEVLLKRVELHLKLSSSINELTSLNENLSDIVKKQIEDIRNKDEILFKQKKMLAISEMVDMMSKQLSRPLELIKMQNQALEFKLLADEFSKDEIEESIANVNEQLNYLDMTIEDFKSFFKQDVKVNVNGNINLTVSFVISELKHIILKLIFNIIFLFKNEKINDRSIIITFDEVDEYIELSIEANMENISDEFIHMTLCDDEIKEKSEISQKLGLHLVKSLVEKNYARLKVDNNGKFVYCLKFFK